jgi:predicted amidophosphoribosyltransferase
MKFLLPTACIACKSYQENAICNKCLIRIKQEQQLRCKVCANVSKSSICEICSQYPPSFDQTVCLFDLNSCLAPALEELKQNKQLALTAGFIMAWKSIFSELNIPKGTMMIPMPLSRTKLSAQGFNLAWEIAHPLAKHYKLQSSFKMIGKSDSSQNQLPSFYLSPDAAISWPETVIVFNDAMGSTKTVQTLAKLLKSQGVVTVINWTLLKRPSSSYVEYRSS